MRSAVARLTLLAPALLPLVVFFIVLPLAVYAPNTAEFKHPDSLLRAAGGFFVFFALLLTPLVLYTRGRVQAGIAKGLFFAGVFMLGSDILAPVQVGQLFDGDELARIPEPMQGTVLEAVFLIAVIAAAVKIKWTDKARGMASAFVAVLLLGQAVTLAQLSMQERTAAREAKKTEAAAKASVQEASAKGGNIYHIVFDSYGAGFDDHAREMNMIDNFDGFTLFAKNLTNADYTGMSMPSFLTGTLFIDDKDPMNAWQRKWRTGDSVFSRLHGAGYRISQYMAQWRYEGDAYTVEPQDLWENAENKYLFWDMVLLRAAPNALQQELFEGGRGLISREFEQIAALAHGRGAWSRVLSKGLSFVSKDADKAFALSYGNYHGGIDAVALLNKMVADESMRPNAGQYVFAHVLLPHGPFNIDRDLQVRGVKTSAHEQSLASVRAMNNLIDALKAQGKYKDALIIFQGDHGPSKETDEPLERGFKKDIRTLLLVKPAGAAGAPLKVSDAPTQLLDVAPTIYAQTGVTPPANLRGLPLFSADLPAVRDFEIFTFLQPFNDDTQELLHYTYTTSGQWEQHPNILPLLDEKLKEEDKKAGNKDH